LTTRKKRIVVLEKHNHICWYCGEKATTLDHVHPKHKGGTSKYENLVAACIRCNSIKGPRTIERFRFLIWCKANEYPTFTKAQEEFLLKKGFDVYKEFNQNKNIFHGEVAS